MYWIVGLTACAIFIAHCYMLGLERFLAKYRWIFVCFLLMPISVIFEFYLGVRNWFIFQLKSAPDLHDERVRRIQKTVKSWNNKGRSTKMCTGRPGWMTMSLRVGKSIRL